MRWRPCPQTGHPASPLRKPDCRFGLLIPPRALVMGLQVALSRSRGFLHPQSTKVPGRRRKPYPQHPPPRVVALPLASPLVSMLVWHPLVFCLVNNTLLRSSPHPLWQQTHPLRSRSSQRGRPPQAVLVRRPPRHVPSHPSSAYQLRQMYPIGSPRRHQRKILCRRMATPPPSFYRTPLR